MSWTMKKLSHPGSLRCRSLEAAIIWTAAGRDAGCGTSGTKISKSSLSSLSTILHRRSSFPTFSVLSETVFPLSNSYSPSRRTGTRRHARQPGCPLSSCFHQPREMDDVCIIPPGRCPTRLRHQPEGSINKMSYDHFQEESMSYVVGFLGFLCFLGILTLSTKSSGCSFTSRR